MVQKQEGTSDAAEPRGHWPFPRTHVPVQFRFSDLSGMQICLEQDLDHVQSLVESTQQSLLQDRFEPVIKRRGH